MTAAISTRSTRMMVLSRRRAARGSRSIWMRSGARSTRLWRARGKRRADSMAYSDFTLNEVTKRFRLSLDEQADLFAATPETAPSELLREVLAETVPLALAIHTEKARSELIVAPILVEVRKLTGHRVSLFSGVDFNVD